MKIQMSDMTLNHLKLRFEGQLEDQFREEYFHKTLNQLRGGVILGMALYAFFGILDAYIFPEVRNETWFIRYAVVCPVCLGIFLFTFTRRFTLFMIPTMMSLVLIGGAGVIAMMVIVRSPVNYFHYAGLPLVIVYSYTFSKLRFPYAALAAWLLVALYEITALRIIHVPWAVFLNDNFFYFSANLIGMVSCFHRELYVRKDFIQTRLIRELEEKKQVMERENIFRDIHDGIGGITTNIGLLAELGQKAASLAVAEKTFATIAELSREGVVEIRNIMRSFDATRNTWQEMAAELRRQGGMMIEPHGIALDIRTSIDQLPDCPGKFLWLNVFRIYKEALTNVMKHSQARAVNVDLNITRERLVLIVRDDGTGIVKERPLSRGITNMKTRAREIGGDVSITSGAGTTVCFELPLPVRIAAPSHA